MRDRVGEGRSNLPRVAALDNYLTNRLDDEATQRSVTISDRFVDTLFHLGQRRATSRRLKDPLR